jgi:hypothetical protein
MNYSGLLQDLAKVRGIKGCRARSAPVWPDDRSQACGPSGQRFREGTNVACPPRYSISQDQPDEHRFGPYKDASARAFGSGVGLPDSAGMKAASVGGCTTCAPVEGPPVECHAMDDTRVGIGNTGIQSSTNTSHNNVTVRVETGVLFDISGSTIGLGSGATVINSGQFDIRSSFNRYGIYSGGQ